MKDEEGLDNFWLSKIAIQIYSIVALALIFKQPIILHGASIVIVYHTQRIARNLMRPQKPRRFRFSDHIGPISEYMSELASMSVACRWVRIRGGIMIVNMHEIFRRMTLKY